MFVADSKAPVGRLVREMPARSRVFERMGIDYCCGGKTSLEEACRKSKVDIESVLEQLQRIEQTADAGIPSCNPDSMTLTELSDHIEATHHAYLKEELPRLDRMTAKVARVHGEKEPKLLAIRDAFLELRNELEPHMMKEERVLFPMVRQLEAASGLPHFHCGTLGSPIAQMEHEHDHAGDALARIRAAADGFVPPDWACNTYRAMLDGLLELEQNMHQHVHKENNILFPKVLELEASRKQS